MTIFYFFLSCNDATSAQGNVPIARSSWASQIRTVLRSRKKLDELSASCISSYVPLYSTLLLTAHFEAVWWVQTNISEYKATNTFVIPRLSQRSLLSWNEWKKYWAEVEERVMPRVFEHQASVFLLYCFKELLELCVSKETCCRLTQHPFHRSKAISARETDRLTAGLEMVAVSLWANLLFFVSNYYVGRLKALYAIKRQRDSQQQRGGSTDDHKSMQLFWSSSWRSWTKTCRRYFYSSLGGGLGSMLWAGWGTMLGIGAGDSWATLQPNSSDAPPDPFTLLDQLPGSTPRGENSNGERLSSFGSSASLQEELLCGCCQIVTFSSNPHSRKRAPVSSRVCDHTICKSCVEQCQLALMERTSCYEEWIKCPLCNAQNAFNCHNHLVNRSLCAAIAVVEKDEQNKTTCKSP